MCCAWLLTSSLQVTISGMLMSVCFLMLSRATPREQLSKQRPLASILDWYMLLSILGQFALHIASMRYITNLVPVFEEPEKVIDLEGELCGLFSEASIV